MHPALLRRRRGLRGGSPPPAPEPSILDRAIAYWRASEYSGAGAWLDESGNGHDAQFGSTAGADSNDPLFLPYASVQYAYFPGSSGNHVSVAGLANTTVYDYTVTYLDDTTDVGSESSDGSGNLVLGGAQANFVGKSVKDVSVVPDGGGAEVAGADFTSQPVEPFATFVGREGLTWTCARTAAGKKLAIVDRAMFLLGTDDYFEIADHADLDFAAGEDFTIMLVFRTYAPTETSLILSKRSLSAPPGYDLQLFGGNVFLTVRDAANAQPSVGAPAAGELARAAGRRDTTAGEVDALLDGVAGASIADPTTDLTNAVPLRIGRSAGAGSPSYANMEVVAAAIVREALTDAEIVELGTALVGA